MRNSVRRHMLFLVFVLALISICPAASVAARPKRSLSLTARSYVLMESKSGTILAGKKAKKMYANASTTKMMTALLCLEKGVSEQSVKISSKAARTPYASLFMKSGDTFWEKDLFTAMLVCSSNDAATALAEHLAKNTTRFARKMTARAKKLGCKNTRFLNPHGLDQKGHGSSAYDLCLIQRELLKYKTYRNILRKKSYRFYNRKRTRRYRVTATDKLIGEYEGFLGGKTGYTSKAGNCFCGAVKKDGKTYLFAVMGCRTSAQRWDDCRKLIEYVKKFG